MMILGNVFTKRLVSTSLFSVCVLCLVCLGVVNVLVTTPLWVVNTRLKLQGAKFRNEDIKPTHYKGILGKKHQS